MRPFFLLAAASAPALVAWWLAVLLAGWPAPALSGGAAVAHAHELVFGFGVAAVAGFALTALPEFTGAPAVPPAMVRRWVGAWLAARALFWLAGWPGWLGALALAGSGVATLLLLVGLMARFTPAVRTERGRPHRAFVWALGALALAETGFQVEAALQQSPMRWLHLGLALLMMLIVVAMSRISMRIVNRALQEREDRLGTVQATYLARPPRRQLALWCMALHAVSQALTPGGRVTAWLALATAAALLQLQADWHVGRALWRRWPAMLLAVYVMMSMGYALQGLEGLLPGAAAAWAPHAGLHLLTIGGVGLNVFVVMCIAGRSHTGLALDERTWVPCGALLLMAAALVRALPWHWAGLVPTAVSAAAWCVAWCMLLWRLGPMLWRARVDGRSGCEGPAG